LFRERIGWVRQGFNDVYETWAVEVLHKDYQGSFDIDTVFLNPITIRVNSLEIFCPFSNPANRCDDQILTSIIYGSNSVVSMDRVQPDHGTKRYPNFGD
jgi:hypothetical protein